MSGKHCYLGVYDISISGTSDIFLITQAHSEDEISGAVAELERQKQDTSTIRVYIDEICDRPVFQELLQNYYSCNFGVDPKLKSYRTGFNGLMSLWKSNANHVWYVVEGIHILDRGLFLSHPAPDNMDPWYFESSQGLFESTQHQSGLALILNGISHDFAGMVNRIMLHEDACHRLTVLISCKPSLSKQRDLGLTASRHSFVADILDLEHIYGPMRTRKNWKQMFLLQYQHANLIKFAQSLHSYTLEHNTFRKARFDPRVSELSWIFKEVVKEGEFHRRLTSNGNDLICTLESLLTMTRTLSGFEYPTSEKGSALRILELELQGLFTEMKGRLTRLNEDLESTLRFLDLERNLKQTNSVERLTILATVFLPLSVATGVLSMQSRFKDLGALLYDFIGVVVLLVTFSALCVLILVFSDWIKQPVGRFVQNLPGLKFIQRLLLIPLVFIWTLTLISFLVGMLKSLALGGMILGYGLAAAIGLLSVFGSMIGFGYYKFFGIEVFRMLIQGSTQ